MRVGLGYDSRPFDDSRPLVLGGVTVSASPGLAGDGDGDGVSRALADALLGAAGIAEAAVEIGVPSDGNGGFLGLLKETVRRVEGENYQVVNADVRVVGPLPSSVDLPVAEMREALADALHVGPAHVSIRRGPVGERDPARDGEGLTILTVALVDRIQDLDTVHATIRTSG